MSQSAELDNEVTSHVQGESSVAPWFIFYNRYYGPPKTVQLPADPFPFEEFPPVSPWEYCVILAHSGVEPIARRHGFDSANSYLLAMIREAGSRIPL